MADTLFIRPSGDHWQWQLFNSAGRPSDSGEGDADALQLAAGEDFEGTVIGVVPGESVLLTTAMVPTRQQRQIVQAVPFVVEERLATDLEDCFFALGTHNSDGEIEVAVVDRELLEGWIEAFDSVGYRPSTVV